MSYKLIGMDFDGTLLTSDKKVTEKTKNILLKYKNNKYIIVGITARNFKSVKDVCDINMFNYLILNNGSYIYDVENKKGTDISNIDKNTAIEITDKFKNIAEQIDYCTLNEYYINKNKIIKSRDSLKQVNSIKKIEEPIARVNIFLRNNDEIDKYREDIANSFEKLDAFIMVDTDNNSNKKWLALIHKGTNKYTTLEKLCEKINIDVNEVIFFGDSTNDLLTINRVGLGVAMGNALDIVKEKAKEVTLSNDEDGIAVFLENLKI